MLSLKTGMKVSLFALLVLTAAFGWGLASTTGGSDDRPAGFAPRPAQMDVGRAQHLVDGNGVPILRIEGVGDVRHPGEIAIYALHYAGLETNGAEKTAPRELRKFRACVDWLIRNLKQDSNGNWAWKYSFDNSYADVTIKTPWASAFGQAVGIEALVASFRIDGRPEHLKSARKAAEILFRSLDQGGLLFQRGDDVWFEEVPTPRDNPSHSLNGHMRSLLAIKKLYEVTGRSEYRVWLKKGMDTLERWLPLFDNGYWMQYDLNPRKSEVLFRITNPYEFPLSPLAIDTIILRDTLTQEEMVLDVGGPGDTKGEERITGNDWGPPETLDGRTVRRLEPINPATAQDEADGTLYAPATYFYLSLPSGWSRNLRPERFELTITYKDESSGGLRGQIQSIAPDQAFRDLRGEDLLLSGSGHWRTWRITLQPSDLGWWVGEQYAHKHAVYLRQLARESPRLKFWAVVADGYSRRGNSSEVILAADHPQNPLAVMRIPITKTMKAIAEAILGDEKELSAHQKIVRFMNFMEYFDVAQSKSADPETIIRERKGTCGEFANVILALAATQGIAGRYVNLHNYPPGNGHTVAEFFVDGKWRVYDPTFSAYYTDTPTETQNPNVLSFEELRAGKGRDPRVKRIVWNRRRLDELKPSSYKFLGPNIYERAAPAGPILDDRPLVFSLALDIRNSPVLNKEEFGPRSQGAAYIGDAGICNQQNWKLSSLVPGRTYEFLIVPEGIGGELPRRAGPFSLNARIVLGGKILKGATVSFW